MRGSSAQGTAATTMAGARPRPFAPIQEDVRGPANQSVFVNGGPKKSKRVSSAFVGSSEVLLGVRWWPILDALWKSSSLP